LIVLAVGYESAAEITYVNADELPDRYDIFAHPIEVGGFGVPVGLEWGAEERVRVGLLYGGGQLDGELVKEAGTREDPT
jgi:hypothetical protein